MGSNADYSGYEARTVQRRGPLYRLFRSGYRFLTVRALYGTLLYPYGVLRHRALLRSADLSTTRRVRQEARRLLKHAERLAAIEDDADLRNKVRWVIAQMEDDHVVQKDS